MGGVEVVLDEHFQGLLQVGLLRREGLDQVVLLLADLQQELLLVESDVRPSAQLYQSLLVVGDRLL